MKNNEPLPPGIYNMRIDRVRKVRNKAAKRIHTTILETGAKVSIELKPDPDFDPKEPS